MNKQGTRGIAHWTCVGAALGLCLLLVRSEAAEHPPITPEYFAALRSGDTTQLQRLLENGASLNARDAHGNTPLMHACIYGSTSAVRLLLDRGADINATNAAGATALLRAAYDFEKVKLLLDRCANANARSALGNTPLILAARPANSRRTVELLLAHGADARATNHFGATALMAAAASGDEGAAKLLIRHGADANAQPTPDEMGFILGGGRNALMWAAFRGDLPMLKLLLEAGADVNVPTGLGTALAQAAWANQTAAARLLLKNGAMVNQPGPMDGYTALHWAASTEERDVALVKLLLENGANPNFGGGEKVDAFMGTLQTPLMLARRRGDTAIVSALAAGGATEATPDRFTVPAPPARELPERPDSTTIRNAIADAVPPLQETSIFSKKSFLRHESRQNCTSCHQQHLPMTAIGLARREQQAPVNREAERELIEMVRRGEIPDVEPDWQPLFHPEPAHTKGYALLAYAAEDLTADASTDAWVHHLSVIQGSDGRWFNNLPRPPIQTDDIGATALAIHALQRYPLPGRQAEFAERIKRARNWLRNVKPQNNEGRIYQLLGLAWAGEPAEKLRALSAALVREQRPDGGWAQLPGLSSDAYATGQALYALRVGAQLEGSHPAVARGTRYLLKTQLKDGTWHVHRRAFPFQPTMNSGFPHGRDSWISAAGSSWAVMALSVRDKETSVTTKK